MKLESCFDLNNTEKGIEAVIPNSKMIGFIVMNPSYTEKMLEEEVLGCLKKFGFNIKNPYSVTMSPSNNVTTYHQARKWVREDGDEEDGGMK